MINVRSTKLAFSDMCETLKGKGGWYFLAWQDVRLRYRRSVLGPFWITISTGIMVLVMGPIYGYLFNQQMKSYIQFLAISIVIWTYISNSINESCFALISSESIIRQVKLPYISYILKCMVKNLILLIHNVIIILIILIIIPPNDWSKIPIAFIGLILVIGNIFWISLFLSIICLRFRDMPQVVASVIQILFFITPILWSTDMLGGRLALVTFNPFYHLIQLVRAPLLGYYPELISWIFMLSLFVLGFIFAFTIFIKVRSRISYYL